MKTSNTSSDTATTIASLITAYAFAAARIGLASALIWQGWNLMPANRDRQISFPDGFGATIVVVTASALTKSSD